MRRGQRLQALAEQRHWAPEIRESSGSGGERKRANGPSDRPLLGPFWARRMPLVCSFLGMVHFRPLMC